MLSPIVLLGAGGVQELVAQAITVVIAFLIVVWILKKFAWGPVIEALDERRAIITRSFDDIDRRQKHLESQVKDYEERLRQVDEEGRKRLNAAVEEGRRIAADIEAKARHDADATIERAQQAIRIETDKARVELRNEIAQLAIKAAGKVLAAELDEKRHSQLVGAFIAEMQDRSGRS